MYKGVIFDLDGTLLNTLQDLSEATNHALTLHGFEGHPLESYKTFLGNGVYKLIERALPEEYKNEATILKVKESFDTYYAEHSMDHTAPYAGIVELLETFKAKGIQIGVVSNKPDVYTKELVEKIFGTWIKHAIGQRADVPAKPNPKSVLEMLKILNLSKEECLFVGDSDVDIATAKNAEVFSVGVLWGFRTKEELKSEGANKLITTPLELLELWETI